jgi:hypothetical protein
VRHGEHAHFVPPLDENFAATFPLPISVTGMASKVRGADLPNPCFALATEAAGGLFNFCDLAATIQMPH